MAPQQHLNPETPLRLPPIVGLVVPCYNETELLAHTIAILSHTVQQLISAGHVSAESFIALIDDGSNDGTWAVIEQTAQASRAIRALKLSRNFGHQNALLAGLLTYSQEADCLISLDADLQDDVQALEAMILRYRQGAEIVYGVRKKRDTDTRLKRWTALGFYRAMTLLGIEIIFNHADYRLLSQRVLQELCQYSEVNLFLRGIIPTLGFPAACVYYDRLERESGRSKYSLSKMLTFAWEGITSFSVKPLRVIAILGLAILLGCCVLGGYAIYSYVKLDVVHGWTSTVLPLYLLGGIQLFSIGIVGEYLGKIYQEVKRRPRFIIEKRIGANERSCDGRTD